MKWFEQSTSEYSSMVCKQIMKSWGVAGYGAYIIMKQVIGQNMNDNREEWGFVSKDETMQSLAEKCGLSDAQFRQFIEFCDERFIFEKKSGRLFCQSILEEKNEYIKKVERRKLSPDSTPKSKRLDKTIVSGLSGQSGLSDVTSQSQPQHKEINSNELIGAAPEPTPQVDKRNTLIDHTLNEFRRVYKFYPTDKKPRFIAQNIIQRLRTITRDRLGGEVTDERIKLGITKYFNWLQVQEGLDGIQKLETAKLKLNIFIETLPKGKHATNEIPSEGQDSKTTDSSRRDSVRNLDGKDKPRGEKTDPMVHPDLLETTGNGASGDSESLGSVLSEVQGESRSRAISRDDAGDEKQGHGSSSILGKSSSPNAQKRHQSDSETIGLRSDGVGLQGSLQGLPGSNLGSEKIGISSRRVVPE